MRILKENTGALIIDIQERLLPHINRNEDLANNVQILIQGLKALGVPVLFCEQYKKGLGATVSPIKALLTDTDAIEKISFSGYDEPSIQTALEKTEKKNVIIAGIEAHICVQQTVIDLLENGYRPIVIEDCVSSRKENDKKIAIERMRQAGAIVTTYESILFELCRYAGTDVFKIISKLVK